MTRETWKHLLFVFVIQVLSQCVFFAYGILSTQEVIADPLEVSWFAACTPFLYTAIQHISGPLWKKLMKKSSDRLVTMLGVTIVAASIVVAVVIFQRSVYRHIIYAIIGGAGTGLVQLPSKLVESRSGTDVSFKGVGTTGVCLILWPLLACFFSKSHGPRHAFLLLAGVTLHALPMAQLLRPSASENDKFVKPEASECLVPIKFAKTMQSTMLIQARYKLCHQETIFELHRSRPPHCFEILPEIPEEDEHDGEHHHEDNKPSLVKERNDQSESIGKNEDELVKTTLKGLGKPDRSFSYPIFVATSLLRLGTNFTLSILISIVPMFAGSLTLQLRIQEKAFLLSLCGFSKLLTELPLLICCRTSRRTRSVLLTGPFLACFGFYWTLDAITVASFALGLGSGVSTAALRVLATGQSSIVKDAADFVVGISLIGMIPFVRTLILGHAIRGCFLLGTAVYGIVSIIWLIVMRTVS